jgi:alpha-glucosidase
LTAEREEGQRGSMHTLYRAALTLRRKLELDGESIDWIEAEGEVLVFRRACGFVCAINFGSDAVELPASVRDAKVLLASTRAKRGTLAANSAAWLGESLGKASA